MAGKEQLGAYSARTIREITDAEFNEQRKLFEKEGARRDYMAQHEAELDAFLRRHRELVGLKPLGEGEAWFEPADIFDAYPKGVRVEHEGKHYRSRRCANMQPPTMTIWWEEFTPTPGEEFGEDEPWEG